MLFHVMWEISDRSEEGQKRSLEVFQKWQPAAGADFKGFYGFADGSGGVAIVEVDSAQTAARLVSAFSPWMDFTITPILPIEEAVAIGGESIAFRDSIG